MSRQQKEQGQTTFAVHPVREYTVCVLQSYHLLSLCCQQIEEIQSIFAKRMLDSPLSVVFVNDTVGWGVIANRNINKGTRDVAINTIITIPF
jgi:hypothetical protein